MFRAIGLEISDLADARILSIMLQALAVAVLIFAALAVLVY